MSEFAGVAKSMLGINLINPYDIESITLSFQNVLNQNSEEKK